MKLGFERKKTSPWISNIFEKHNRRGLWIYKRISIDLTTAPQPYHLSWERR
jgi:hypothetical protein